MKLLSIITFMAAAAGQAQATDYEADAGFLYDRYAKELWFTPKAGIVVPVCEQASLGVKLGCALPTGDVPASWTPITTDVFVRSRLDFPVQFQIGMQTAYFPHFSVTGNALTYGVVVNLPDGTKNNISLCVGLMSDFDLSMITGVPFTVSWGF